MAALNKRYMLYGAVAIIGIAGFYMTEPKAVTESDAEVAVKKPAASNNSRTKKAEVFTEADEKAKFARLDEPVNNVFTPSITEGKGKRSSLSDLPNQIPPAFMNGETGWFLTGIVNFDGHNEALFENTASNEGQYLSLGQSLKLATLMDITRNTVTLAGPNGLSQTFTLLENRPIVDGDNLNANNSPFDPLVGNIGISQANNSASNRSAQTNKNGIVNEATNATN